ncbi:hypothetical protein KIN20_002595 [Parelaphostrongylus tenuis]|uniref:Uncharacterized protein n=1 Tax=Parelaphostrongylus tenuis TaxID=148309 RepID=A0AAD5MH26_PARTN|nr:hypothetical protein KIN20_002595 [Parelaphostrongylus tenuis]
MAARVSFVSRGLVVSPFISPPDAVDGSTDCTRPLPVNNLTEYSDAALGLAKLKKKMLHAIAFKNIPYIGANTQTIEKIWGLANGATNSTEAARVIKFNENPKRAK